MLFTPKVLAALKAKQEHFIASESNFQNDLNLLKGSLEQFSSLSLETAEEVLTPIEHPGARPTAELDQHKDIRVTFPESWDNHRQARTWALNILRGTPTFAADGSQITPSKDISVPVGVVQVGWFENLHSSPGSYVKDVEIEILASDELAEGDSYESAIPEINLKRFVREVEVLNTYMFTNRDSNPKPLCFFDGSFVISFIQRMHPNQQQIYIKSVLKLLDTSRQTTVPLVAYVDTSYARDLTTMLTHLSGLQPKGFVSDSALLRSHMKWGDRSQVFICDRHDESLANYYQDVCFVYLKVTADNPPARVEFPRWIFESNQHERVLDLVRAECVVGTGYPYVLETADAIAVLSMQDRERFYSLFQEFAEREDIALRWTRKSRSKRGRRS
ncbi:DNA double-strand break repair nuclease NurA [Chloroflexota bacterium]